MQAFETVTVPDMMEARESRAFFQRALLAEYPGSTLVCLTMNVAGPVKSTPAIERAFAWGLEKIRAVLAPCKTLEAREKHAKIGPEAVLCVLGDAAQIKQRLCMLEDGEPIGRLLDIDVLTGTGEKISRTELGLPPRKCLLCGKDAPVCARSRTHTVAELFARTNGLIEEHFEKAFAVTCGERAQRALLYEVAVSPKPGLVDRENSGAHGDMDIFTFLSSAAALRPYFEQCAAIGMAHRGGDAQACFDALRVPGLLAEAEMRRATNGVNTHKGAIFSLGIACAALGMGFDGAASDPIEALARCGEMTRERMAQELSRAAQGEAFSFGERLYQQSGNGGVRDEAAGGFASVREAGLPRLRQCLAAGLNENDTGLCVLVSLMARTQDTNAIRRGGEAGAAALKQRAQELDAWIGRELSAGTLDAQKLRAELRAWDVQLSAAHISPGGCADLLAMTFFIGSMEK